MASRIPKSFVRLGEQRALAVTAELHEAVGIAKAGKPEKTVAMIVCHGMGQQVPFETIDSAARVLRRAHLHLNTTKIAPEVTTRVVDLGIGSPVGRAELTLADDNGGGINVHIYEAYWAPLTAGKVTLRQVVAFLVSAGLDGLLAARQTFLRWMFHGWQEFGRSFRTFGKLLIAIFFVLSLIVMNATIVAVSASRGIAHDPDKWPMPNLLNAITADFVLVLCLWSLAGIALGVAYWFHQHINEDDIGWNHRAVRVKVGTGLATFLIWLGILGTIFVTIMLGCDLYRSAPKTTTLWEQFCANQPGFSCWLIRLPNWLLTTVWALVVVLSYFIRKFLVEYLGDVVAYVNAHELSTFHKVRDEIRLVAHEISAAVYALRDSEGDPVYSRVVFVGHSLGSVLAYDTLNRLLLEDSWRPHPDTLARTGALITFGSPLDKTAFIFRRQKPVEAEVRESLAAGVQPLIADSKYRQPLKWFNLWSRADWISGSLAYYDPNPPVPAWQVENAMDDYSSIPLLAHIMYWRSPQLASALLRTVTS